MWSRLFSFAGAHSPKLFTNVRTPIITKGCQIHRWVSPTMRGQKLRQYKMKKDFPNIRNKYLEWNFEAELYAFGKRLNEEFDAALLRKAFTHRSYIIYEEMQQKKVGIENPDLQQPDNDELIKEGEFFMKDYIRSYVEAALPKFPEEGVTAVTDHLMSDETLSYISTNLGTKDIILSEDRFPTTETLAKTFKAIVAALAHSSGAERAAHFVRDFVITALNGVDVNDLWVIENPMHLLEELLKKKEKTVEPRLMSEIGKNTILACYQVGIYVDKEMFCAGFGESIQIAKEMAAREGLKLLFGTPENMPPLNFKMEGIPKTASEKMRSISP